MEAERVEQLPHICNYLKGTFGPESKNYIFFLLAVLLFIELDCCEMSLQVLEM